MSVTNPIESPIVNANPIVGENPIQSPTIIHADTPYNPNSDFSCGCSATIPPGSRVMFMKFAAGAMIVGGVIMYGLFKLSQYAGWM